MATVTVRDMRPDDLPAVCQLSAQLATPTEPTVMEARFRELLAHPPQGLYVAECEAQLIGWIHVQWQWRLEVAGFAEITGLIVDEAARRSGAGRALVTQAVEWARAQGATRLRVRSNAQRVESHQFYPAVGFALLKTQHNYERRLGPNP